MQWAAPSGDGRGSKSETGSATWSALPWASRLEPESMQRSSQVSHLCGSSQRSLVAAPMNRK